MVSVSCCSPTYRKVNKSCKESFGPWARKAVDKRPAWTGGQVKHTQVYLRFETTVGIQSSI